MNKNFTLTLLIAAALIGFSMSTNAQEATGSVDTNADVITPISITGNTPLDFGSIVGTSGGGTITVGTDSQRTATDANLIPSTGGITAAKFTVSGQAGYTYSLSLPDAAGFNLQTADGLSNMLVDTFVSNLTNQSGTLSAEGNQVVNIGANLTVGANQTAGAYTSATGLTVTVQYN